MSINYYTNKKEFLQFLKLHSHMAEKYSLLSLGSGFMDLSPGFHPAGHTSSGFSWTYCNAWERYQQLGKYTKTKKFPLTNCLFPSKISQLEFKTRTLHPFRISWSCFYLESSHCFINAASNGKIVNSGVLNDSLLVNDEKSSQCDSLREQIAKSSQNWMNRE